MVVFFQLATVLLGVGAVAIFVLFRRGSRRAIEQRVRESHARPRQPDRNGPGNLL